MLNAESAADRDDGQPVKVAPSFSRKQFLDCVKSCDGDERYRRVGELTEQAIKLTGRGLDLTQADLSRLNLSNLDLRRAILNRTSLYGTSLVGADLSGVSLVCAGLERTDFSRAKLCGAYAHAMSAQASKFVGADLSELVDATGSMFHGCDLTGATLDGSELAGTTFYQCGLTGATLRGADLRGAMFNECRVDDADLARTCVDDAVFLRCGIRGMSLERSGGRGLVVARPSSADGLRLVDADLPGLRLSQVRSRGLTATSLRAWGIDVQGGHLRDADLSGSELCRGRWDGVALERGNLSGASVADSSWVGVSASGLRAERVRGEGWVASECSFPGAVLTGFAGRYATFRNCDLRAADLSGSYLYRASFVGDPPSSACLAEANLDGANLTQAYLAADFTRVSLRSGWAIYARVNQSDFSGADLAGTSLFRASAVKTVFTGARLGGQRGMMLADRCPGLADALLDSDDESSVRAGELIGQLGALLARDAGEST